MSNVKLVRALDRDGHSYFSPLLQPVPQKEQLVSIRASNNARSDANSDAHLCFFIFLLLFLFVLSSITSSNSRFHCAFEQTRSSSESTSIPNRLRVASHMILPPARVITSALAS